MAPSRSGKGRGRKKATKKKRSSKPPVTKRYVWKEHFRAGGTKRNAELLGEAIEQVRAQNGRDYRIKDLVDYARPKGSPIHHLLEWNDKVAGEKYRQVQMGNLERHLEIEVVRGDKRLRMPVSVSLRSSTGQSLGDRMPIETAMSSKKLRKAVVEQALYEAKMWSARWKHVTELKRIHEAIEREGK